LGLKIPDVIVSEHDELKGALEKLALEPYPLGDVAQSIIKVLEPHVQREEQFALPPLSLLPQMVKNKADVGNDEAITMAEKLKASYQDMHIEHNLIMAALEKLRVGASNRDRWDVLGLVERFNLHIQTEEEILYPATVLIGEYFKLKKS
jgi:hypothetical protein